MDLWVGHKETQPEPDPLPFLTGNKQEQSLYISELETEKEKR